MKILPVFALAFAAGFAASVVPSCGPPGGNCGAGCAGCCGADGVCYPGSTSAACGTRGGVCVLCSPAEVCSSGVCTVPGPDGGGCSAANCQGCCSANGTCLTPSNTNSQCGQPGTACQVCSGTQQCTNGQCVDNTCTGCVNAGVCVAGTVAGACGTGGVTCQTCTGTSQCHGGTCVCGGCVDGTGTCQSGSTNVACGTNGSTCQVCANGSQCTNGACVNPTCNGCVDGSGTCQTGNTNAACGTGGANCSVCTGASQCTNNKCVNPTCNGCVDGTGTCQTGTSNTACGTNGVACVACTGHTTCSSGTCVPVTCTGCFDTNNVCQPGNLPAACGASGANCQVCTGATPNCTSGACTGGGFDGGTISCSAPATYNTGNGSSCGSWRWSIKTGSDSAASAIVMVPQATTIAALGALTVPSGLGTSTPRTGPENTLWILKNVTAVETKLESDSDYHIPIKDPVSGATMEAEIPFPKNCVQTTSPFYCFTTHARAALEKVITPTGSYQPINQPVTIIGPALFDMLHGSSGAAPNGIEIHPILAICFGTDCNPLAN